MRFLTKIQTKNDFLIITFLHAVHVKALYKTKGDILNYVP